MRETTAGTVGDSLQKLGLLLAKTPRPRDDRGALMSGRKFTRGGREMANHFLSESARAGFKCVEALVRIIIRGPTHPQML